jgi:hypothetical protein
VQHGGTGKAICLPDDRRAIMAAVRDIATQVLYVPHSQQSLDVIATAEKHTLHPDSVRKIASQLHERWERGDPYTVVVSHRIKNPDCTPTDKENNREVATFHHRKERPWDPNVDHSLIPITEDFIVADSSVYVFAGIQNRPQQSSGMKKDSIESTRQMPANIQEKFSRRNRICIYNATSRMSAVSQQAFEKALHRRTLLM